MCLEKLNFSLAIQEDGSYIGIGYKRYSDHNLQKYNLEIGQWSKATGNKNNIHRPILSDEGYDGITDETAFAEFRPGNDICEALVKYHPGFHIWLNKKDAKDYRNSDQFKLYKVEYRNVIAFGTNYTDGYERQGPCIIALEMRLVEVCV